MPRNQSLWRPVLALSGLALLAACSSRHPVQQSSYVAPAPTPTVVPEATVVPAPVVPTQTPVPVSTSNVMTTSSGMTVYVYDRDMAGRSTCYDACAAYWPPVYAPAGAVATGGLALITRGDGRMQWATSDGMPLYTSIYDRVPGDIHGNNIDGSWHVVAAGYGSSHGSGYASYGPGYPYNDLRTVTADGAAVTIQPDANSAVVTVVNAGAQVKVLDSTNGPWTHVEANGQDGFMRTGALR
jgi:predicted lipoprotein with Yx(FWY)xxD motif